MRFKVLKSSADGICGGDATYDDIENVLWEIFCYKGWNSVEDLHEDIQQWAKRCEPGDVFRTQASVIVAIVSDRLPYSDDTCPRCHDANMDYGNFSVEEGDIEQEVRCLACGAHWIEVFTFSGRRYLN